MTTYGTPEAKRTQDVAALTERTRLDLEAVPAPNVRGIAAAPEPEPEPADCEQGHTPVVYLVIDAGIGVANASFDETVAIRDARTLRAVVVAVPVLHDFQVKWPPVAEETAHLLGIPTAA